MDAEIITIGTELLLGQITDTNASWLAQQLAANGLNLFRKVTVGDNEARIAAAISDALDRVDVVITSGGLGPTVDDVTREAVARATGRELVFSETLYTDVAAFFRRRGTVMSDNNRRQAYIPAGAIPIPNPVGTAPCFAVPVERGGKTRYVITLPGVPRELKHQMTHAVIPLLREKLGLTDLIKSRILRVVNLGESRVDQHIGDLEKETNPTVGLAAHAGQVDVRITARAGSEAEANAMLDAMETRIRERLGSYIFGLDQETLEGVITRALVQAGVSLALVETNTGGRVAQRLAQASAQQGVAVVKESIVAMTPDVLRRVGGVGEGDTLVSEASALRAAHYVRRLNQTDIGLAIVSPLEALDPYSDNPGATYIALADAQGELTRALRFGGVSDVAMSWSTNTALDILRRRVLNLTEEGL
ncbi:MAG: CinA family nicotinamide mononucleotide deamidase-related protein [Anaerolineae bacterium]|nr:CinA family nicotinamide mononucleotide deamidase-related protein [Anaerolineae bacterium]